MSPVPKSWAFDPPSTEGALMPPVSRCFVFALALAGLLAYPLVLFGQDTLGLGNSINNLQSPVIAQGSAGLELLLEALDSPSDATAPPACPACRACQPPAECNSPACQAAKKAADLKKAVASAYAPLFYNNNFAYINNPAYDDWYP